MTDQPSSQTDAASYPLRPSWYDRTSSWLLSSLLIAGVAVAVMLVAWFNRPLGDTRRDNREGGKFQLVRAAEVEIPAGGSQLMVPSDEPAAAENRSDVDVRKNLDLLDDSAVKAGQRDDLSATDGDGVGIFGPHGPDREPGPPGEKTRHWEVIFDKTSLGAYARQLDFFHIELGALLPTGRLAYAANLSKSKPDMRYAENPHETEKRYYLTWHKGNLEKADRELLTRAGIDAENALILKFLPPALVERLAALEKAYAGAGEKKVKRTRFGVRPEANGFAFFVLEQTYVN